MTKRQTVRSLSELKVLKKVLQKATLERAIQDRQAREIQLCEAHEKNLFVLSIGLIQPIKTLDCVAATLRRPEPRPLQRVLDEVAVMAESLSDEFDVDWLLETDDTLSFRRDGIGADVVRQLRQGVWAVQAHLDLHGLRSDEARARLAEFLREVGQAGMRCVRIVHGKGHGSPGKQPVLKIKVRRWLAQKNEVLAFTHARAADGGHGALLVLLQHLGRKPRS
jgi:DNA-nicking Smr family endonuclease